AGSSALAARSQTGPGYLERTNVERRPISGASRPIHRHGHEWQAKTHEDRPTALARHGVAFACSQQLVFETAGLLFDEACGFHLHASPPPDCSTSTRRAPF